MFCGQCGGSLRSNVRFCTSCGAPVQREEVLEVIVEKAVVEAKEPPSPDGAMEPSPSEVSATLLATPQPIAEEGETSGETKREGAEQEAARQIIGKNVEYYVFQFNKIQTDGAGNFNQAAFWVGLPHAAYRNVWKQWVSFMKVPFIANICAWALFAIGCVNLALELIMVGGVAGAVACVLSIVWGFRYGKQFNELYFLHVRQVMQREAYKPDPSYARVFVVILVDVVIGWIIGLIISVLLFAGTIPLFLSDYDIYKGYDTSFDETDGSIQVDIGEKSDYQGEFQIVGAWSATEIWDSEYDIRVPAEPTMQFEFYEDGSVCISVEGELFWMDWRVLDVTSPPGTISYGIDDGVGTEVQVIYDTVSDTITLAMDMSTSIEFSRY